MNVIRVYSAIIALCVGLSCEDGGHSGAADIKAKRMEMRSQLRSLFEALEAIGERHEEIYDTDVREQMADAIHQAFVLGKSDYRLPDSFGMFRKPGNSSVRDALEAFTRVAPKTAREAGLLTPRARLGALQDSSIETKTGQAYDSFIGHMNHL